MVETKTLSQVADEIGVPANTIKTWLHQLDFIPAEKDSAGRWRFPSDAEEVLRQIHALRLDGRSLNTVRRRLDEGSTAAEQVEGEMPQEAVKQADEPRSTTDEIAEVVTAAVVQAIQAQTEQAEKYARATYEIGELRERVRGLEAERERLLNDLAESKRLMLDSDEQKRARRSWWRFWD